MGHNFEILCCVDAPEDYAVKAKYALKMLLMPLGLQPVWVQYEDLTTGGIYYGPDPGKINTGNLGIFLRPETIAFFQNRNAYSRSTLEWRFWENERWPVLFGGSSEETDDYIASSFFWLSGWQEYTVRRRDFHGRFAFNASLQHELGIGGIPCVDAYRERLCRYLQDIGVSIHRRTWSGGEWAFCPTHDIDYMRKWRPGMIYRELVHYLLANQLHQPLPKRLKRFGAFLLDFLRPVDAFRSSLKRIIKETHERGGKGTYFFKAAAHGPRDVHYSLNRSRVKRTLSWLLANDFEIGLHPSYFAYNHQGYMSDEKSRLEQACGQVVLSVRQHYLRYETNTSRLHVEEGFEIDSTLAFADREGFRRGTCLPFKVFDIDKNKELDLWEMPLSIMDGTVFNYRHLSGDVAFSTTTEIMQWCKRFGGVCIALWHNTLWDELDFPGWGDHFISSMDYAVQEGAHIGTLKDSLAIYLGSEA